MPTSKQRVASPTPARAAPANSSRDEALSCDQIVSAAVGLIDREGIHFSMRRLASSLDISGPALYWHFRSRDELLHAALASVLAEVDSSRPNGRERWDRAARRMLLSVWRVAGQHPGLLEMMRTQPLHTESGDRLLQSLLVVLRRAGFGADAAVNHARSLLWTTFGFIRSTAATLERVDQAQDRRVRVELDSLVDSESAALLADCVPALASLDIDALFEHTLDLMLAAVAGSLEAQRGAGATPKRSA
jgi:AcrR family transcriptional regulator